MSRIRDATKRAFEPLGVPAFRRFMLARGISSFGNAGTRVAVTWYVLVDLERATWLALVLIAFAAPQFFLGQLGGAIADRHSRLAVVVGSELLSSAALFVMWLLAEMGQLSLPILTGLAALAGAGAAMLTPSAASVIPYIVPENSIGPASGLRTQIEQLGQIVGPGAAGVVIAVMGAEAWFLLDSATFALGAIVFATIRLPAESRVVEPIIARRVMRDMAAAARYCYETGWLRVGLLAVGVGNLLLVAPLAIAVPVLVESHDMGATTLGLFGTALAVGTVVGAVAGGLLATGRGVSRALGALTVVGAIAFAIGGSPHAGALLVFGVGLGIALAVYEVIWNSYELSQLPKKSLASVLAWDQWISFALRTLGLSTIGVLAATQPEVAMMASSTALVLVSLCLLVYARKRGL